MYQFAFERPTDIAAAVAAATDDSRFLSGGQTLIPTLKMRLAAPDKLIDLNRIDGLSGIADDGGALRIGARTRHAEVAASEIVRAAIPALSFLAGGIGDQQVRNRGTIGGSIANNDPAADYPSAVLGLGGTVITDRREIDADAFFTGMFETALEPGELVTGVRLPKPKTAGYQKMPNPASRYPIVGVFIACFDAGVRVAVTGAGPCVFRHEAMEAALTDNFAISAIEGISNDPNGLNEDIHATAEYRAHLIGVMARRALAMALAG